MPTRNTRKPSSTTSRRSRFGIRTRLRCLPLWAAAGGTSPQLHKRLQRLDDSPLTDESFVGLKFGFQPVIELMAGRETPALCKVVGFGGNHLLAILMPAALRGIP